jgi:hypothetical protein
MSGPCLDGWCVAEVCDGTNHVDETGEPWAQPGVAVYCPFCLFYDAPHEHDGDQVEQVIA